MKGENLKICKRGNVGTRDKWGHCLCLDCKAYNKSVREANAGRPEYLKQWQAANRDKANGYSKKWRDNNKEKRNEIVLAWRQKNPDKVKEMNKKGGAKWAKNNKGKRNAITRKRQLSMIQRTPSWADLNKIRAIYMEAERLTRETGVVHEVDHIIPLQGENVCGLHVHNNLQILSRSINRSKGNKTEVLCAS